MAAPQAWKPIPLKHLSQDGCVKAEKVRKGTQWIQQRLLLSLPISVQNFWIKTSFHVQYVYSARKIVSRILGNQPMGK